MGHKHSKPKQTQIEPCREFKNRYGPDTRRCKNTNDKWPFTRVRLTIGSHWSVSMGGSTPSVAIFDEWGHRLGQTDTHSEFAPAGSFRDIVVQHSSLAENGRPSYLLLQSGRYPVCIAALSIKFFDGQSQTILGDDIDICDRLKTEDSHTFLGPHQIKSKCFWFHGFRDKGLGTRRISLHTPDWDFSRARRKAYDDDDELLCHPSPRFFDINIDDPQHTNSLSWPIPIFNPPILYDSFTHFDRNPEDVLTWEWHKDAKYFSDQNFQLLPHWKRDGNETSDEDVESHDDGNLESKMVPFTDGWVEDARVRTGPPRLVISDGEISAEDQCAWGEWNHTDYVSLSEKVYCDMQSRSMFHVCHEEHIHNCWNPKTRKLQGFEEWADSHFDTDNGSVSTGDVSAAASSSSSIVSWAANGPLFGYSYPNITITM